MKIRDVPFVRGNAGRGCEGLGTVVIAGVIGGDLVARRFQCDADRFANAARPSL